ncbi:MAG: hypothetical protein ABW168_08180 [Sedimenticola sp.]
MTQNQYKGAKMMKQTGYIGLVVLLIVILQGGVYFSKSPPIQERADHNGNKLPLTGLAVKQRPEDQQKPTEPPAEELQPMDIQGEEQKLVVEKMVKQESTQQPTEVRQAANKTPAPQLPPVEHQLVKQAPVEKIPESQLSKQQSAAPKPTALDQPLPAASHQPPAQDKPPVIQTAFGTAPVNPLAPQPSNPVVKPSVQVADHSVSQPSHQLSSALPGGATGKVGEFDAATISNREFVELDNSHKQTTPLTAAQQALAEEGGYGWGVLDEYADPDRASRVLGGHEIIQVGSRFFRLTPSRIRTLSHVKGIYGLNEGLKVLGRNLWHRAERALQQGELGHSTDNIQLWYLFLEQEARHLKGRVVATFECQIREQAIADTEVFRKTARLRNAVYVLKRESGGQMGVLMPRYFDYRGERQAIHRNCLGLDTESRRTAQIFNL